MKLEGSDSLKKQKIVVGTNILFSNFFEESINANYTLKSAIEDSNCELYTTIFNLAELYHIIEKRLYEEYLHRNGLSSNIFSLESFSKLEKEKIEFKRKFDVVYNKIKKYIHIEKYYLDENFEKEFAKKHSKYSIFEFILESYRKNNNIEITI